VCNMFGASGRATFQPEDMFDQKVSVYLMFDDKAGSSRSLTVLLYAINRKIKSLADANPDRSNRILFVLEELGSVPMPHLPQEITTASGRGITFLYATHDIPQLEELYGVRGAKTILNNTGAKVFYATSDQTTAEYVEKVMGYISVPDVRVNRSAREGRSGNAESTGHYKRELLPAHEMFTLQPDEVIVEYRPHKIRGRRVNWRDIPELKNLDKLQPLKPSKPILAVGPTSEKVGEADQITAARDDQGGTYIDLDD
jgi:type IV secretion system protein VirD4